MVITCHATPPYGYRVKMLPTQEQIVAENAAPSRCFPSHTHHRIIRRRYYSPPSNSVSRLVQNVSLPRTVDNHLNHVPISDVLPFTKQPKYSYNHFLHVFLLHIFVGRKCLILTRDQFVAAFFGKSVDGCAYAGSCY